MTGSYIYTLKNIQVSYDHRLVLDIDSFSIRRGEILAVVGPSGAGKSTLLRQLNFLEHPGMGSMTFDGELVSPGLSLTMRRRVTTVFQHPLMLQRSVLSNLRFGVSLRGHEFAKPDFLSWLDRMGLDDLKHQSAKKLSAGEMQRVALARALIVRPDVLLLDEPTANLDPANVSLIEKIVREENRTNGTTVVLVTHNIFQARRLANRTMLLIDGKIVEIAPTEEFFDNPAQELTAAFLRGEFVY